MSSAPAKLDTVRMQAVEQAAIIRAHGDELKLDADDDDTIVACPVTDVAGHEGCSCCGGDGLITFEQYAAWLAAQS